VIVAQHGIAATYPRCTDGPEGGHCQPCREAWRLETRAKRARRKARETQAQASSIEPPPRKRRRRHRLAAVPDVSADTPIDAPAGDEALVFDDEAPDFDPVEALREMIAAGPQDASGWVGRWESDTRDGSDVAELAAYAESWAADHPAIDMRWEIEPDGHAFALWVIPESEPAPEPEPAPWTTPGPAPVSRPGPAKPSAMNRLNCSHGQHAWQWLPGWPAKRCIYCPSTAPPDWAPDDTQGSSSWVS
jgi:hypothetical protein